MGGTAARPLTPAAAVRLQSEQWQERGRKRHFSVAVDAHSTLTSVIATTGHGLCRRKASSSSASHMPKNLMRHR